MSLLLSPQVFQFDFRFLQFEQWTFENHVWLKHTTEICVDVSTRLIATRVSRKEGQSPSVYGYEWVFNKMLCKNTKRQKKILLTHLN